MPAHRTKGLGSPAEYVRQSPQQATSRAPGPAGGDRELPGLSRWTSLTAADRLVLGPIFQRLARDARCVAEGADSRIGWNAVYPQVRRNVHAHFRTIHFIFAICAFDSGSVILRPANSTSSQGRAKGGPDEKDPSTWG
jgi:hypothetical protein